MPSKDRFNINPDFVEDLKQIRANLGNALDAPVKIPAGIAKTIKPVENLTIEQWFAHVNKSLRQRDLFGNLI